MLLVISPNSTENFPSELSTNSKSGKITFGERPCSALNALIVPERVSGEISPPTLLTLTTPVSGIAMYESLIPVPNVRKESIPTTPSL